MGRSASSSVLLVIEHMVASAVTAAHAATRRRAWPAGIRVGGRWRPLPPPANAPPWPRVVTASSGGRSLLDDVKQVLVTARNAVAGAQSALDLPVVRQLRQRFARGVRAFLEQRRHKRGGAVAVEDAAVQSGPVPTRFTDVAEHQPLQRHLELVVRDRRQPSVLLESTQQCAM